VKGLLKDERKGKGFVECGAGNPDFPKKGLTPVRLLEYAMPPPKKTGL
jgi:hypothetical protein